jgi:hypothetical protein
VGRDTGSRPGQTGRPSKAATLTPKAPATKPPKGKKPAGKAPTGKPQTPTKQVGKSPKAKAPVSKGPPSKAPAGKALAGKPTAQQKLTSNTAATKKAAIGSTGTAAAQKMLTPQSQKPARPKPPVPKPGNTPYNFIAESPALANWKESTRKMLERAFSTKNQPVKFKTFEDAQNYYRKYLKSLKSDAAREKFGDRMRERARKAFYRQEYKNPTFDYNKAQLDRVKEGAAPEETLQLEHLADVKTKSRGKLQIKGEPENALNPENIYFTQGGPGGTAPKDTKHAEKYETWEQAIETSRKVRERATGEANKAAAEAEKQTGAPVEKAPGPQPTEPTAPAKTEPTAPEPAPEAAAPEAGPAEPAPPTPAEPVPEPLPPTSSGPVVEPVPGQPVVEPVPPVVGPKGPTSTPWKGGLKTGLKEGGKAALWALLFVGLDYLRRKALEERVEKEMANLRQHMRGFGERQKKSTPNQPVFLRFVVTYMDYQKYFPVTGWMPEPLEGIVSASVTSTPMDSPELRVENHEGDFFYPGTTTILTFTEPYIP